MAMKLLDLYKSMMATAGLLITKDNLISVAPTKDTLFPVTVGGKRLALPTREILARPDKTDIVVFHPLMENPVRGPSDVLEHYLKMLAIRFNEVASTVMLKLLFISASVGEQHALEPDQAEFLTKVKNVDDKTIETFEKIVGAMPIDQTQRRIVTFFLKKTGSVLGKRYKRVGVVSFPLYDELKKPPVVTVIPATKKGEKDTKKNEYDVYGVKCRAKDKEAYVALLEYIFPNIETLGSYNRGSDSDVAANLDALMQASLAVISALNAVTETFESRFSDEAKQMLIECDWQESFTNLGALMNEIRMVPMQSGNEGASEEANKPELMSAAATGAYDGPTLHPTVATPAVVTTHTLPAATAAPTAPLQKVGTPLDPQVEAFAAEREKRRQQQEALERGWQTVTHQHQQPQVQQPVYNPAAAFVPQVMQHQYMPPPTPVNTGRGLDFGSVMASNPALAMATGGMPGQGQFAGAPQPQGSRFFQNWNAPQSGYYQQPQQQPVQGGFYQPGGYQRSI
jgi:hypothetical protein